MSDGDHGVREPTLTWDQLARSENLREELRGKSERSQTTETKDDADVWHDFW